MILYIRSIFFYASKDVSRDATTAGRLASMIWRCKGEGGGGGGEGRISLWKSVGRIARIKLSDFIRATLGARTDIGRYDPRHRSLM